MKKVILILTFIIAATGIIFAIIEAKNYYDKKNKIDNNTLVQEVEENIKEVEDKIKTKTEEEQTLKEENKDKIEEMEKWQKKTEDMGKNL